METPGLPNNRIDTYFEPAWTRGRRRSGGSLARKGNAMATFGLVYLIAYLIDCLVSILATLIPPLGGISNFISSLLFLGSVFVVILGSIGKLRPRRVFLPLSIFYLCLFGFGIVLGIILAIDVGPDISSQKITMQFLCEHFSWYRAVHWTILIVLLALAVYGLSVRLTGHGVADQSPPPLPRDPLAG